MVTPSVLTICVNYYNDKETAGFVKQLLGQNGITNQKVVIVNNSEFPKSDSPLIDLSNCDKRALLYNPGKNLGYYGGAAYGLREFTKLYPLPEWVIVCNTDIDLIQPDLLSNLFSLYSGSASSVIAPSIISNVSGRDQNPYMKERPTSFRMHFYKWAFRYYPISMTYQLLALVKKVPFILKNKIVRSNHNSNHGFIEPQKIYAPHGSFVAFNRKYFEAGGTLNHGVFLFGEEVFIAETAKRLGLTIVYDSRLKIVHREYTTTNFFRSPGIPGFVREAAEYCANTFFR